MGSPSIWTIKAALDWCCGYLERKGDTNPRLSAEWLLAKATGLRRVGLYVNFNRPLSSEERRILRDGVARRGAGEPLQYITGEVGFRHITVKVRPGVLIPRPETEVLVSEALSLLPAPQRLRATDSDLTEDEAQEFLAQAAAQGGNLQRNAAYTAAQESDPRRGERSEVRSFGEIDGLALSPRSAQGATLSDQPSDRSTEDPRAFYVADIGTGSGCIACSIAYEHPDTRVVATDISPDACALVRENVSALGLVQRVHVTQGSLGSAVPERFVGALDLVVSNPPYVPTSLMEAIPREVADFEPRVALDGGSDGLELFRPLTTWAYRALKPGGGYAVELHETCLDAAADIARAAGFFDVRVISDLTGRPRILTARKLAHSP